MCNKVYHYNITTQEYVARSSVNLSRTSNGFTVYNTGNTTLFINNVPIVPGGFLAIGGNAGEVYRGRVDLDFRTPAGVMAPQNSAWFIEKFYMKPDNTYNIEI